MLHVLSVAVWCATNCQDVQNLGKLSSPDFFVREQAHAALVESKNVKLIEMGIAFIKDPEGYQRCWQIHRQIAYCKPFDVTLVNLKYLPRIANPDCNGKSYERAILTLTYALERHDDFIFTQMMFSETINKVYIDECDNNNSYTQKFDDVDVRMAIINIVKEEEFCAKDYKIKEMNDGENIVFQIYDRATQCSTRKQIKFQLTCERGLWRITNIYEIDNAQRESN